MHWVSRYLSYHYSQCDPLLEFLFLPVEKSFIEKKHMESVSMDSSMLNGFKKKISHIEIMRSTELMALAFEKGLFEEELGSGKQALEASLFALKYNGCAVSVEEILKYLSTVK